MEGNAGEIYKTIRVNYMSQIFGTKETSGTYQVSRGRYSILTVSATAARLSQ